MGCTKSVPDQNLTNYKNNDRQMNNNNKNRVCPQKGSPRITEHCNNNGCPKQLKGDLLTYNLAKLSREKTVQLKMEEREKRAQDISMKILDEREKLSLFTTQSRTTSKTLSTMTTGQVAFSGLESADASLNDRPERGSSSPHVVEGANEQSGSDSAQFDVTNQAKGTGSRDDTHVVHVEEAGTILGRSDSSSSSSPVTQSHDQVSECTLSTIEQDGSTEHSDEANRVKKSKHHKSRKKKNTAPVSSVRNDMISHG